MPHGKKLEPEKQQKVLKNCLTLRAQARKDNQEKVCRSLWRAPVSSELGGLSRGNQVNSLNLALAEAHQQSSLFQHVGIPMPSSRQAGVLKVP